MHENYVLQLYHKMTGTGSRMSWDMQTLVRSETAPQNSCQGILDCDALYCCGRTPVFWRTLLPSSPG